MSDVESQPLTLRTVVPWATAAIAVLSSMVAVVVWATGVSGRIDLVSSRETTYEANSDSTRAMLQKEEEEHWARVDLRAEDLARKLAMVEQDERSLQLDVKTTLVGLEVKIQNVYDLLQQRMPSRVQPDARSPPAVQPDAPDR